MKSTTESAKRSALKKSNREARNQFRKKERFVLFLSVPSLTDEDERQERRKQFERLFKSNKDQFLALAE